MGADREGRYVCGYGVRRCGCVSMGSGTVAVSMGKWWGGGNKGSLAQSMSFP